MTTSNKLLLGIFLSAVLALTGTQVALYAKYKAGDFEQAYDIDKELYLIHKVPGTVKLVYITGFDNCSLSHGGEYNVKVRRSGNEKKMSYQYRNDTLFLMSDTTLTVKHFEAGLRNNDMLQLTLPFNVPIQLNFSALALPGGSTPSDTPSYNIVLNPGSRLSTMPRYPEQTPIYFGKLNITSIHSEITLDDFTTVNELNLTAQKSDLRAHRAVLKTIHLDVDDSTNISLTKRSLQNVQIAPKP